MNAAATRRSFRFPGPGGFVRHYACRALQRLGGFDLELAFCLTPDHVRVPDAPDLRCERIDADALRRHAQVPGNGLEPSEVEASLERGDWCFGVLDGQLLACHLWFSSRPTPVRPGLLVHFDRSYAYSFWAFTREEYRGRHLHALGKGHALEVCRHLGLRGILSLVRADNAASLASAARVGCRRVGSLLALGPGRRPWVTRSPGCRRFGLRLEAA